MLAELKNILKFADSKGFFILVLLMAFVTVLEMCTLLSIVPFMGFVLGSGEFHFLDKTEFLASNDFSRNDVLVYAAIFLVVLTVFSGVMKSLLSYYSYRYSYNLEAEISSKLFAKIMEMPYDWYLGKGKSDLIALLLNETRNVVEYGILSIILAAAQIVLFVFLFLVLMFAAPILTLILGGVLILVYASIFYFSKINVNFWSAAQLNSNKVKSGRLNEGFRAFKEIRLNRITEEYTLSYRRAAHVYSSARTNVQVLGQIPRHALEVLMFGGVLIAILFFLKENQGSSDSLADLVLFAFAGLKLIPSAQHSYYFANLARSMRSSFKALDDVIKSVESENLQQKHLLASARTPPNTEGLEFDCVTFNYDGSHKNALEEVSFKCLRGQVVAFVGMSGSGKTTLIDIALGLLTPVNGVVKINGCNVFSEKNCHAIPLVGYVPQDVSLVEGSLEKNITLGSAVDGGHLGRTIEDVALSEFIESLPDGLETLINDNLDLSGGQRQRVGIARALIKKPDFLVLDECTSALDTVSEKRVIEAIYRDKYKRCTVIIAHRLSTIEAADEIFVMKDGCIVARGTYNELVCNSSLFKSLVNGGLSGES